MSAELRDLGVRYVARGSVRRMEDTVRVNARSSTRLWRASVGRTDGRRPKHAGPQDNFGIANQLDDAHVSSSSNAEGRRAPRADPDAVDLACRAGPS